jgi:fructose-1-phosphate kinase PfkB-like protein
MAIMNDMDQIKKLSEVEIDEIVISQAEDDSAWEETISVHLAVPTTMSLSPEIAARAAFFAQLHKKSSVEDRLRSIIQERIDFEEAAFTELKQALLS